MGRDDVEEVWEDQRTYPGYPPVLAGLVAQGDEGLAKEVVRGSGLSCYSLCDSFLATKKPRAKTWVRGFLLSDGR